VVVRKANLRESEIDGGVTTPARTLMDCLRYLPLVEGLCVADSALREGFSRSRLDELAANARGPGAMKIKLNAQMATPEAANPFESALRGIALGVTGLAVTPQVPLREGGLFLGRPDLVDRRLRIVLEADSAQFHATVAGINRDTERYDRLAVNDWLVLRFTWQQVLHRQHWVRDTLAAAVAFRQSGLGRPVSGPLRTY
jgi:very-short-patch-repair endonuclease